jgi:hypothetical protein
MRISAKVFEWIDHKKEPHSELFTLLDVPITKNLIEVKVKEKIELFYIRYSIYYGMNTQEGNKCFELVLDEHGDPNLRKRFLLNGYISQLPHPKRIEFLMPHENKHDLELCAAPSENDFIFFEDKCYQCDPVIYSDNKITAKAKHQLNTIKELYNYYM